MQIIYPINAHLDRREPCPVLDAVQGETARAVTVSLYEKEQPWTIPAEARVLVRYGRPDGCGGIYDTLSDGSKACTWSGNSVTAVLAPQALAVAGLVSFQLAIVTQAQELATFIFLVRVESDPSKETAAAEDLVCMFPEMVAAADRAEADANRAEAEANRAEQANKYLDDAVIASTSSAESAAASARQASASEQTAVSCSEAALSAAQRAEQAALQASELITKTTLFQGTPSPLGEVIVTSSICQFDLVLFHLVKSDGALLDMVVQGSAVPSDENAALSLPPYLQNGTVTEAKLQVLYGGAKLQSMAIAGSPYTLTSVVGVKFGI